MTLLRISLSEARRSWLVRQRLATPAPAPPLPPRSLADVVGEIGWIAAPSPAVPYLVLLARGALTSRAELDDPACKRGELVMVPGPRGSTYLVPTADAPVARAFAVADHASREARVAAATTLTSRDLEGARDALRAAMESAPASPEALRARVPERFLRSLGDAGRKAGVPTVAALVLRSMWVTGEVMRVPAEGRLDRPAVLWGIDPRPRTVPTAADAVTVIAGRWLAAHAPLSPKAFGTALGIAAGRANAALKALKPVEVEVEGIAGTLLAPAGFAPPAETTATPPRLLPLRDPLGDVQSDGLAPAAVLRAATTRSHGVGPCAVVDGEIVGSWAYDEVARVVTWRPLGASVAPEVSEALDLEARRVAAFIANELTSAPLHTVQPVRVRPMAVAGGELAIEV